jgi:hypothetical protein
VIGAAALAAQPGLAPEVYAGLAALPTDCAALWQRILEQRRPRPA